MNARARLRQTFALAMIAPLLLLAACGGSSSDATADTEPTTSSGGDADATPSSADVGESAEEDAPADTNDERPNDAFCDAASPLFGDPGFMEDEEFKTYVQTVVDAYRAMAAADSENAELLDSLADSLAPAAETGEAEGMTMRPKEAVALAARCAESTVAISWEDSTVALDPGSATPGPMALAVVEHDEDLALAVLALEDGQALADMIGEDGSVTSPPLLAAELPPGTSMHLLDLPPGRYAIAVGTPDQTELTDGNRAELTVE